VGSLRPIRTAHKTLGGRTLERPSCGGLMPTAETTLLPTYSATSKRSLTSSAQLDNEPNSIAVRRRAGRPVAQNLRAFVRLAVKQQREPSRSEEIRREAVFQVSSYSHHSIWRAFSASPSCHQDIKFVMF